MRPTIETPQLRSKIFFKNTPKFNSKNLEFAIFFCNFAVELND